MRTFLHVRNKGRTAFVSLCFLVQFQALRKDLTLDFFAVKSEGNWEREVEMERREGELTKASAAMTLRESVCQMHGPFERDQTLALISDRCPDVCVHQPIFSLSELCAFDIFASCFFKLMLSGWDLPCNLPAWPMVSSQHPSFHAQRH